MRCFFLFLIAILFSSVVFGQISQPTRYEIEIDKLDEPYNIVSAEENGIYIFKAQEDKNTKKENSWEIIRIDTSLQEVSRHEVLIDDKFTFRGYSYQNGQFVMLFQEGIEYAEDLLFITFKVGEAGFQSYVYKNVVPIKLTEFELKDDAVIFGGDVNMRAVLMVYNFTQEKGFVLPGFYTDRSSLLQIVRNTNDEWFRVVTSERRLDKTYGITVRAYSTRGELIYSREIDAGEDRSLTNGRIVNGEIGANLLAGTYSKKRRTETSRGLFIADLAIDGTFDIQYYNYANLENFFNYMREKRKARIKRRIQRKKIKGKKLKFSYRLYVQDIIQQNDQNILIGEAYYPTYTSAPYGMPQNYWDPFISRRSQQVFDGYKYTHAIIIGFDNEGSLLWDNSFEINDLKSFFLEEHVQVVFTDNKIVMLYLYDQQLKVKVIREQDIIEGKSTEDLRLKYDSDEIKGNDEELEGLEKWYSKTFYAYGVNRVKNLKDSDIELNRKVFFINKIVVD
jgi:hypothetical protein